MDAAAAARPEGRGQDHIVDETVDHERAVLVEVAGEYLLVCAMEVRDADQARRSAESGTQIDAEHRAVLEHVLAEGPTEDVLPDLTPD